MQRIGSDAMGVDTGNLLLFSDFEDGGAMWTGEGPRLVRRTVSFSEPFRAPPAVFVTPEMWDYDCTASIRGDLTADEITEDGFDVVFKIWNDTRIARLRIAWMAIGPVVHPDDWEV